MAQGIPLYSTWTGPGSQILHFAGRGGRVPELRGCPPDGGEPADAFVSDVVGRYRAVVARDGPQALPAMQQRVLY